MLRRSAFFAVVFSVLFLAACGRPTDAEELGGARRLTSPYELPFAKHTDRNDRIRKHYFLVAGGSDAANYAWEIVQQMRYLRARGVEASDIACFYARPDESAFAQEAVRWSRLAPELAACYPASAALVYDQIDDGGQSDKPVFFYVSSHGSLPLSQAALKAQDASVKENLRSIARGTPTLDQFFVQLASSPEGVTEALKDQFQSVIHGHRRAQDILLTPKYLRAALDRAVQPGVSRHVVVQACYSGGFIDGTRVALARPDGLRGTDYSILTASRADRGSFGCGVGTDRTYFGGAFNDALFATKQLPHAVDFRDLHRVIVRRVEELEREHKSSLPPVHQRKFESSEPQVSVGGGAPLP